MKFNLRTKLDIKRVLVITAAYVIINLFLSFYNFGVIASSFSLGLSERADPLVFALISVFVGLAAGVLGGTVLVYVNKKLFQKKSYRFALITTILAYSVIFFGVTFTVNFFMRLTSTTQTLTIKDAFVNSVFVLLEINAISNYLLWGIIALLTLFFLQVSDKFGPGILMKFIAGKYFHPKDELRIFMFLDIKSSTKIAEKIGHKQYFNLLRDFYAHITDPIIDSQGEIYQYVGDEVVISWELIRGIKDSNCVNCFFNIKKKIYDLSDYYKNNYNFVLDIKAGLHYGKVTAGEIGIIKREIIYTGDVLNTTARIQEQCNKHGVDFIVTTKLYDLMREKGNFELFPLGNIELRGKQEKVELNAIKTNI